MRTTRALMMVAALAVFAALVLWHSHRNGDNPQATGRLAVASQGRIRPAASDDAADPESDAKRPAPPAREMIARDPEAAARLWSARARNVLRAKNRKEYGEEIARLLELPYDEAWGPLVEKSREDIRAAVAASFIQSTCTAESTRKGQPHGRERPASSFYKNLPEAMKPFIDRIAERHTAEYEERVAHCDAVGNTLDLTMILLDTSMRPDNVDAQIQVAGENDDKRQAIADLRAIVAKDDTARGRFALGDLLMQSDDAAERGEGRAMLEALALNDPEVANRLAYCLRGEGCSSTAPDLAAARSWFEVSAGLGDQTGLSEIEHALAADGDRAAAWAWSLYGLDLALDGCFEMFYPSHIFVAGAARTEAERRAGLTPTEQNAGLAISYAIEGQWAKRARERLACE